MPQDRILLIESGGHEEETLSRLGAVLDEASLSASTISEADFDRRAVDRPEAQSPAIVLLGPQLAKPLHHAREAHRAFPFAQIVFLVEEHREDELRRQLMRTPMIGSHWSIARPEDEGLERLIRDASRSARQRMQLRTTLGRMNRRLADRPTGNSIEYRRLATSDRYLASILDNAQDAIFSIGDNDRIVTWNAAAERLFGHPADVVVGRPVEVLSSSDGSEGLTGLVYAARAGEKVLLHEIRCRRVDGTTVEVEVTLALVLDEEGEPVGVSAIARDITERRRQERVLREAKEEAEKANQAKDHFLAVLSHELRTPLNPILLAASSMLESQPDPEDVRPTLEMIRQNVKLQARLIDDLLDVMRIVQGKMPLHWDISDCHTLIEQSVQICRSDVLGKSQQITLELTAEHHHVNADSARLNQVVWNLVRNAVKFTPDGGSIAVSTRNEVSDGLDIIIEVADTGIGIPADVMPTIFDPFQQGETTITRRFGGLGLGLAICKGIVDAHGGRMEVESEGHNLGTVFRVVLRTMPTPQATRSSEEDAVSRVATPPLTRLNILLVEDEPATLRLMARLLRGLGHKVTSAGTVAEAWDSFNAGVFDMIISDIGLPDGTGLDLMRKVKAERHVPAIALTGYGMDEDVRRSRDAGFTTHMTKPIDFAKLEAMIRQVVN